MARNKHDEVLEKVLGHESLGTMVCWIVDPPIPGLTYIEGHGHRVAIVRAGDDGYMLTGNWPYEGKVGQVMPWFWGKDLDAARLCAEEQNTAWGVSKEEAFLIVARTMARGARRHPPGGERR